MDGINHCYLLDASDDNDGASPSFLSICCFGGICNNDCDLVDFSFAWVLCVSERCVCCWFSGFFRWRDGSVFERWWEIDVVGRYKISVLVRVSDGRFSSGSFERTVLLGCDVESIFDDKEEFVIISIGLA